MLVADGSKLFVFGQLGLELRAQAAHGDKDTCLGMRAGAIRQRGLATAHCMADVRTSNNVNERMSHDRRSTAGGQQGCSIPASGTWLWVLNSCVNLHSECFAKAVRGCCVVCCSSVNKHNPLSLAFNISGLM